MERIGINQDTEDDKPIETDIFSDPDQGFPICITKKKDDKDKYVYTLDKESLRMNEDWSKFWARTKITDEQWAEWEKQESLTDLYTECYTTRDFDLAMNGLAIFDKQYKYNIFQNEEFMQLATELRSKLKEPEKKEDKEEESPSNAVGKSGTADIEKVFDSENSKNVKEWPKFKCKKFLKNYVVSNYDGADQEPYLQEIEKLTIEGLHVWCQLGVDEEELPVLNSKAADDVEAPDDVEVVKEESTINKEINKVVERPRRQR
jgi:hypothetical protein